MAHAPTTHDPHDPHAEGHAPAAEGDDIPQHAPVLEEPRSAVWLPYLGAALLGLAAVWWLSSSNDDDAAAKAAAAASASAAAETAEAPEGAVPPPNNPPPRQANPNVPPGFTVSPHATLNPAFRK